MTDFTDRYPTAPAGRIEVLPHAIARVAAHAAATTHGVVGLALPTASGGDPPLPPAQAHRGARVRVRGDTVEVELFVVIRYGARVAAVAEAASERVRAALEVALGGVAVVVQLRVQGLQAG
jgi:uncharacterized alkaline shock family protein YloU